LKQSGITSRFTSPRASTVLPSTPRSGRRCGCPLAQSANYLLVLFDPKELLPNTTGQQIRCCCERLNTRTDTILLDAAESGMVAPGFTAGAQQGAIIQPIAPWHPWATDALFREFAPELFLE
jgi:hypothetical protein